MNVFLTGATGYIGSVVAETLAQRGHTVIGLARSDEAALQLDEEGHQAHRGDLSDPDSLRGAALSAGAVIHLAAGEKMAEMDTAAVRTLLDALNGTDTPFIYTSGVWVLGNTGDTVADEDAPTDAPSIVAWRPTLEDEVLGAGGTVIRPAIVYGRGGGIPAMLVQGGREHGVVRYVGDGTQHWPVVHVDDLADLYVRALEAPSGTLLHGATGEAYPVREIAEAASHAAGLPGQTEAWPLEEAREALGPFAEALALDQQVSGERAKTLLDWQPQGPSILEDLKDGSYAN